VDLGPAPGSGIVTASVSDISEASDNESGNGNGHNHQHLPSMGVEMTESMTLNQQMAPSSLMQFNQDVESMLQHSAMRVAMNNQSSSNNETSEQRETSKLEVESRSSRGSSSSKSVDLGPPPGSGIVTASVSDISEASDNESGNGNGHNHQHLPSMGVEMTESMTLNGQQMAPSSLMQFNQDVESMLQHSAMRVAMNNQSSSNNETSEQRETSKLEVESRSSRGSSSSKSVDLGPREDFTQHY
jgi:hypothetical protein